MTTSGAKAQHGRVLNRHLTDPSSVMREVRASIGRVRSMAEDIRDDETNLQWARRLTLIPIIDRTTREEPRE